MDDFHRVIKCGKRTYLAGNSGWYRVFPDTTPEAFASSTSCEVLEAIYKKHVFRGRQKRVLYDSTLTPREREEVQLRNELYLYLYPPRRKKR